MDNEHVNKWTKIESLRGLYRKYGVYAVVHRLSGRTLVCGVSNL